MRKLSLLSALILSFGVAACSDDDDDKDCVDLDGDGYGVGADCLGPDCDDDDPTVWTTITAYPDADEDGYYSPDPEQLCESEVPEGYRATAGDDCDDSDATVWQSVQMYEDNDGDGYGAGDLVDLCVGDASPIGYVDNGDDCDDEDPYSWDSEDASHIGCDFAGTCVDTEMGTVGYTDYRGIGACQSVDCNGQNPYAWDPTPEDTGEACTDDADCDPDFDEFCYGDVCWEPPASCTYDVDGLTCSEIPDCLTQCGVDHGDNPTNYAMCLQFTCFEGATPRAQFLYSDAQDCAAQYGCFVAEDMTACVASNCMGAGFGACLADTPPE